MEKYYNDLKVFYKNIWLSKAEYKVFVSERAFELNCHFINQFYAEDNENYELNSIILNSAIFLYVEEIAEYYIDYDHFPSILIIDDILMFGRRAMKLIDTLVECLITSLQKKGCNDSEAKIKHKLYIQLNLYFFARNNGELLTNDRLCWKCCTRWPLKYLRDIEQKIAIYLYDKNVYNNFGTNPHWQEQNI